MQNEEKKRRMKQEQERYEQMNNKDMASYMGIGNGPDNASQLPAQEVTGGFPGASN